MNNLILSTFDVISNSTSTTNTSALYIGNCLLVDPDGYPYVEWMYNLMGQCVHSPLEQSSFYVGLGSLALYIVSGIPQVIENFMKGNADGLSPYTLAMFIIGDSSNLLGAILTRQLFTQILLAIYFVTIEVILISQFLFYKLKALWNKRKHKGQEQLHDEEDDKASSANTSAIVSAAVDTHSCTSMTCTPLEEHNNDFLSDSEQQPHHENGLMNLKGNVNSTRTVSLLVLLMVFFYLMFTMNHSSNNLNIPQQHNEQQTGRRLLSTHEDQITTKDHNSVQFPPVATEAIIGYTIGFISTTCSIGSRIAQIIKNFMKGTYGMNPLLFGCSVFGNILYSSSIFLFSVNGSFLLYKIPWLTSSLVNICLDSFIIAQYIYFTFIKKKQPQLENQKTLENSEKSKLELQNEERIENKLKALEV